MQWLVLEDYAGGYYAMILRRMCWLGTGTSTGLEEWLGVGV